MNVKQTVIEILKKYPITRSSDKELLLMYYAKYCTYLSAYLFIENHFQFIKNFQRYRASIQASGLYHPAKKKVKEFRDKIREAKMREFSDYNGRKGKREPLQVTEVKGKKVTKSLLSNPKKGRKNK